MRSYVFGILLFSAALLGVLPYIAVPQTVPTNIYYSTIDVIVDVLLVIVPATIALFAIYFTAGSKRGATAGRSKIFQILLLWVASFTYAAKYFSCGLLPKWAAIALPVAALISTPIVVKMDKGIITAFLSALAGTTFVWMFPPPSALAIIIALSIYDLLMVYGGPLGRLAEKAAAGGDLLAGLVVDVGDLSVGIGDFFGYSMALTMIGVKRSTLGPLAAIGFAALGLVLIYIGLKLTVKLLLKRRGHAPALPIPMALALPLILF